MNKVILFLLVLLPSGVAAQENLFLKSARASYAKSMWTVEKDGKPHVVKGRKFEEACDLSDPVDRRIFLEYGAMFLSKGVTHPMVCVFKDQAEVAAFQKMVRKRTENIGGTTITLQESAMNALLAAIAEAAKEGKSITPRGGPTGAARIYDDTARFWNNRFSNGLEHWMKQGRIRKDEADAARALPTKEQIARVLEWEAEGVFFSTGFNKSILYSVAAPGTSQHLFLLALDVTQFADPKVRGILMKHGWFQTVKSDQPHFTYLGRSEKELPGLGMKTWMMGDQRFWIPDFQ